MAEKLLHIKPHHFIDIITRFGSGKLDFKPHSYGHALHQVARAIIENKDIELEIDLGIDDICRPCRHNVNSLCDDTIDTSYRPRVPSSKHEWNLLIDNRWCKALELNKDQKITIKDLCKRIQESKWNIDKIYVEISHDRNRDRLKNLKKGISRLFQGNIK